MRSSATAKRSASARREVARALAEAGLPAGPRRLSAAEPWAEEDLRLERLGEALRELGPAYAAFGLYVAGRPDLLPAPQCLRLHAICDRGEPLPPAEVERRLDEAAAAGRPAGDLAAEPVGCGLLFQDHRLEGAQRRRWLRLLREPGLARGADGADELGLEALAPLLGLARPELAAVRHGFQRALAAWIDTRRHAELLAELAPQTVDPHRLVLPEPRGDPGSEHLLVVEWPGEPLAVTATPSAARRALARRLALVWLQQALVAGTLLVEADWVQLPDGRVSPLPREVARLPAAARATLWEYLRRSAEERSDEAAPLLLREMEAGEAADGAELERRLRQIVPYRDGCWTTAGETLGEHLALHWRAARDSGFAARPHLAAFWRGLFALARTCRRLDPDGDALREAVGEMRWQVGWQSVRRMNRPQELRRSAAANLVAMLELPERLDRLLDQAEGRRDETAFGGGAPTHAGPQAPPGWGAALACALGLLATALVVPRLGDLGFPAAIAQGAGAVLFLAFGVLALRALLRGGPNGGPR